MIKKILDYYYLVLIRTVVGKLDYKAPPIMALSMTLNLFSFAALLMHRYHLNQDYIYVVGIIPCIVIVTILQIVYTSKRTKRIKEEYKDESRESRRRGAMWVLLYEVFTILFVIGVAVMTKNQ